MVILVLVIYLFIIIHFGILIKLNAIKKLLIILIHVFSSGNEAYKESSRESSLPILYPNYISVNIVNIWISVVSVSKNGKESYYTNRAGSICQIGP